MNSIFKILSLLTLLVILTAEDCSNPDTSVRDSNSMLYAELEQEFKADTLTTDKIVAIEKRSLQMIEDLVDYINFYADTSKSVEFRKHLRPVIREMFVSEDDMNLFFEMLQVSEDTLSNIIYFKKMEETGLRLISCKISENIKYSKWETYMGKATFETTYLNKWDHSLSVELIIVLQKVEKKFGDESILVWKILFCIE